MTTISCGIAYASLLVVCTVSVAAVDQTRPVPTSEGINRRRLPPAKPTVRPDGTVVVPLPDGTKRLTRPGVCGWRIVDLDGKEHGVVCNQVQVPDPPGVPDAPTAGWLEAHNESLLAIARTLLGQDPAVNNYLKNYENPTPTLYRQIRLRTELIGQLTR